MQYKEFQGMTLSALGMGTMRLPVLDNDQARVDEPQVKQMVAKAMAAGVNYYDTAWSYHDGNSETAIGSALRDYPRSSFYLADKFPGYDLANMDKVEEIFEAQLKKCGVDYFDFYLIHNVCEMNIDAYLDEKYGILPYLLQQKEAGRIRHFGFSVHGSMQVLERFMAMYGPHMEFCQIQLNYMDWTFQDAKAKVDYLTRRNIPIWVMEPLRGGKLARLPEQEEAVLRALRPDETIPAWAFRFLQHIPNVVVTLSGMSDVTQMEQNLRTFETDAPLTEAETEALLQVADRMIKTTVLPCTACRYCVEHCPQGLDIPYLLELYNEQCLTGGGFLARMALAALPREKRPRACVGCRSCEAVCPQQIRISEAMGDFVQRLKA